MKTTENISLAGYAFTIETDAYAELAAYIEEIRRSFSNDESVDEITSDIEERIAELLNEKCCKGVVVNIDMIRDIKKRIGNPQEFAQDDSAAESSASVKENKEEKRGWKSRKLYRNLEERVLGGVCSGLGTYFGLDKIVFRILFLVFFFIGFSDEGLFCIPMVLYICLWIAMPAARTVEQKCEMRGKPINLEGFRSKDFDLNREVKDAVDSPAGRTIQRVVGLFIGLFLLIIGLGGLLGCIFIPAVPSLIDMQITSSIDGWAGLDSFERVNADIFTNSTFWALILVNLIIGFFGMLYGGIMLTFDLKSPKWKPGLVLFIAWLVSLLATSAWVIKAFADAIPGFVV